MLDKANDYLLKVKRMVEAGEDKVLILNELNALHDVIFEGNTGSTSLPSTMQEAYEQEHNSVSHPSHYCSHPSGIECIEVTRHYCFSIGNAIKYLWRAGLKQSASLSNREKEVEDLNKSIWYIIDRIKQLGGKPLYQRIKEE